MPPDFIGRMVIPTHIQNSLLKRKEQNAFRSLIDKSNLIDFSSNDFFGLARNSHLHLQIEEKYEKLLINKSGASGSRLLNGHSEYFEELENKLAKIQQSESALILNSGYNANLSLLSSVPQKGDTIIYDEKAHASIKDGARLSIANHFSFKHNSVENLESKLRKSLDFPALQTGEKYVVVESIYSMDGDFCDIKPLIEVCEKYNAHLIVDEAHSTGIYGGGAGWCVEQGVEKAVFARVMTFGKAIGSFGACILGSEELKNYLINFARPFIYTTALQLHTLVSIECAFDYVVNHSELKIELDKNINYFKSKMKTTSISAIQSILVKGNDEVKKMALELEQKGLDVRPILSPTVKEGEERLRVCLHNFNTKEEIDKLVI